MGAGASEPAVVGPESEGNGARRGKRNDSLNVHNAQSDIKIHSTVSYGLDFDHESAMKIPLGEVTDEQLLAEVARRKLDLHNQITDSLVKESYTFDQKLGKGASGEVLLVTNKQTNIKYACKVIAKNETMNDAQSMSTEMEIMKRIRHRNIVSMYELYESSKCMWVILELVDGGDLHHHVTKFQHYSETVAAKLFRQCLAGLHYLHSLGVVHRDLKLDNILLKGSGDNVEVKIADFGLSALVRLGEGGYDANESSKRKKFKGLNEMWGTKEYFAPELIEGAYGPQADMWSMGCILYEMLIGKAAFPFLRNEKELYTRIQKKQYDTACKEYTALSQNAKDLISTMLTVDPVKRASATEALRHPWIVNAEENEDRHLDGGHSNLKDAYANKK